MKLPRIRDHKWISAFRRGLTVSPFQIPLLAYLAYQGTIIGIDAQQIALLLHVKEYAVWNLAVSLIAGGALATIARFNDSERMEFLGLAFVAFGLLIVVGLQVATGQQGHAYSDVMGSVAIALGCALRMRVLSKALKAERVAVKLSVTKIESEQP